MVWAIKNVPYRQFHIIEPDRMEFRGEQRTLDHVVMSLSFDSNWFSLDRKLIEMCFRQKNRYFLEYRGLGSWVRDMVGSITIAMIIWQK